MNMNINDIYGNRFMTASEISGSVITRIEKVWTEEFNAEAGGQRAKVCILTDRLSKAIVLNKTNAARLAQAFGADATKWVGHFVTVSRTTVMFRGRPTLSILVEPAPDVPEEEVPF